MSGFRKHGRTTLRCAVTLTHKKLGEIVAETRDISETGVFVSCKQLAQTIAVGDQLQAKLYSDRHYVSDAQLRVVRLTDEGAGLLIE